MLEFHDHLEGLDWETLKQDLLNDNFHNGRTTKQLQLSFENSQHVAMAFDEGRCIGNARMLSDGVGNAYVLDVWTHSGYRGQGIATTLMRMLIEAVPGQHIYLQADDTVVFYKKLGFQEQPSGLSFISGEYLQNDTR